MKLRCFEGLDASANPSEGARNRTRDAWRHKKLHGKLEVIYGLWYSSLVAQRVKCLPAVRETWVLSLRKEMVPWMEKPGRLQSMGSQRVRHD